MGVEFRWLDGDDLDQIAPIVRQHRWVPINKQMGRARAAFIDGELAGFAALTCIPHVDGLWISRPHRGTGIAEVLVSDVVTFLYEVDAPAAYIIADSPVSELLAKAHGMEKVESPVYRKIR